jgi:hypothetical protein
MPAPTVLAALLAHFANLKVDFRVDWKEDTRKDWIVDWPTV